MVLGELCESLVTLSAFSLPVISLWPRIHTKDMCLPAEHAMWHESRIFFVIPGGLTIFLKLVIALSESLNIIQRFED